MLEERLGPAFKRDSLAKYIDELLEREVAEAATEADGGTSRGETSACGCGLSIADCCAWCAESGVSVASVCAS